MKIFLRVLFVILIVGVFAASYFYAPEYFSHLHSNDETVEVQAYSNLLKTPDGSVYYSQYTNENETVETKEVETEITLEEGFVGAEQEQVEAHPEIKYIETPESVKAVYMTSWVAGTPRIRKNIIKFIEESEINSIIIDIKDDTGRVSFEVENQMFIDLGSSDNRVSDMRELIAELHEKNIYVIGRIAVFQDPYLIKKWPAEAVKSKSNPEALWADRKGLGWFDANSEAVWNYVATLAEESTKVGFDEINFDYIRFPSDGNMSDLLYPYSSNLEKSEVIETFFQYLDQRLRPQGIVTSADLFGMTTTNTDDLNIGQILEKALPYFDYVCPMVYPSHYPDNWAGIPNPASQPYKVIHKAMSKAYERAVAMGEDPLKLRPWLQDFDLGAKYTSGLVRDQIIATYDVGLNSWLMWDARNTYTKEAYKKTE